MTYHNQSVRGAAGMRVQGSAAWRRTKRVARPGSTPACSGDCAPVGVPPAPHTGLPACPPHPQIREGDWKVAPLPADFQVGVGGRAAPAPAWRRRQRTALHALPMPCTAPHPPRHPRRPPAAAGPARGDHGPHRPQDGHQRAQQVGSRGRGSAHARPQGQAAGACGDVRGARAAGGHMPPILSPTCPPSTAPAAAPTCTCPTLRTPTAPPGTTWCRARCGWAGPGWAGRGGAGQEMRGTRGGTGQEAGRRRALGMRAALTTQRSRRPSPPPQINLRDAVRGTVSFEDPASGKKYALKVRRAWLPGRAVGGEGCRGVLRGLRCAGMRGRCRALELPVRERCLGLGSCCPLRCCVCALALLLITHPPAHPPTPRRTASAPSWSCARAAGTCGSTTCWWTARPCPVRAAERAWAALRGPAQRGTPSCLAPSCMVCRPPPPCAPERHGANKTSRLAHALLPPRPPPRTRRRRLRLCALLLPQRQAAAGQRQRPLLLPVRAARGRAARGSRRPCSAGAAAAVAAGVAACAWRCRWSVEAWAMQQQQC